MFNSPIWFYSGIGVIILIAYIIKELVSPAKPTIELPDETSETAIMDFMRKTIALDSNWELHGSPTLNGAVFINEKDGLVRKATFNRTTFSWMWQEEALEKPEVKDEKEPEVVITDGITSETLPEWFADNKDKLKQISVEAVIKNKKAIKLLASELPEDKSLWEAVGEMICNEDFAIKCKVVEDGLCLLLT